MVCHLRKSHVTSPAPVPMVAILACLLPCIVFGQNKGIWLWLHQCSAQGGSCTTGYHTYASQVRLAVIFPRCSRDMVPCIRVITRGWGSQ